MKKIFLLICMLIVSGITISAQNDTIEWLSEELGSGIKPAIAIDAVDTIHVAYIVEADMGSVEYLNNESGAWESEEVSSGYFYGPLDIAVSLDGIPHIAYHDHQDTRFSMEIGDAVVAVGGDSWQLITIEDSGHDGWDNSIVVDNDGNWHTVAIEPSQFGLQNGAEYSTSAYSDPGVVEVVPGGATVYEFATSIDITETGIVGVTYYASSSQDLIYAERSAGEDGNWTPETVDSDGNTGRYSALVFDENDNPHIAYFVAGEQPESGIIRYSWRDDSGEWQSEDVAEVDNVVEGSNPGTARKITSIAFDSQGALHLAYTNNEEIVYATRDDSAWTSQTVTNAEEQGGRLGSLIEMALDSNDTAHIVYYVLRGATPIVMYTTVAQ